MTNLTSLKVAGIVLISTIGLSACDKEGDTTTGTNPDQTMTPPDNNTTSPSTSGYPSDQPTTQPSDQSMRSDTPPTSTGAKSENVVADSAITVKVKAALLAKPEINSLNINVDTINGVTTLSGSIDNEQQRDLVVQAAKNVSGVKDVVDQLVIKATS